MFNGTAKRNPHLLSLLLVLALATPSQASEEQTTYLGVMEPSPVHYVGETSKTPVALRVAFLYKNGSWNILPNRAKNGAELASLLPHYPKDIDWTLGFDGKKIGQFQTHRPSQWPYYSDVGLTYPDTKMHIPTISKGAKNFCYWSQAGAYRPLVASSGSYVDDPDDWKLVVSTRRPTGKLISAFRKAAGTAAQQFPDGQISVKRCYRSREGDQLIGLGVPNSRPLGEDFDSDQCDVRWFHLHGNEVNFLGNSLELVDAGDYDHDGHSEIVFHKPGYNYDAYILTYQQLHKQLEFGWSYH